MNKMICSSRCNKEIT